MIECPKCGHENSLGRLFCDSCGQRLDVSGVHPTLDDQPVGRRKRKKRGAKRGKRRLRWLLPVVLVAVVVAAPLLAAWRPTMPAARMSLEQAGRYRSTRDRVMTLMLGQGAKVAVLQDDVNSYIAYSRQRRPEVPRALVSFEEDGVRAFVCREVLGVELVAVFRWITGGGDTPAFRPASISIGHLPLPTAVFPWAATQFPMALQAFDTELRILNNCVSARVPAKGRLLLEVKFRS